MTFIERVRAAWQYLERLAEAMDYDPVEELRRRVERLERSERVGVIEGPAAEPTHSQRAIP